MEIKKLAENTEAQSTLEPVNRYLHHTEVETITGLSPVTIWREEQRNAFPKRREISKGRVGWLLSEINEWLTSRGPSLRQKPIGSGRPAGSESSQHGATVARESSENEPRPTNGMEQAIETGDRGAAREKASKIRGKKNAFG